MSQRESIDIEGKSGGGNRNTRGEVEEKRGFRLLVEIDKNQGKVVYFSPITLCLTTVRAASVCERLISCADTMETSVPLLFSGGQYKAERLVEETLHASSK